MVSFTLADSDASASDLTTYPFTFTVAGNPAATYVIVFAGRATSTGRTAASCDVDGQDAPLPHANARTTQDVSTTSNAIGAFAVKAADLPVPTNAALAVNCVFSGAMIRCVAGCFQTLDDVDLTAAIAAHDEEDTAPATNATLTLDLNVAVDSGLITSGFVSGTDPANPSTWGAHTGATKDADVTTENATNVATFGHANNVAAATPRTVSLSAVRGTGANLTGPVGISLAIPPAPININKGANRMAGGMQRLSGGLTMKKYGHIYLPERRLYMGARL